MTAATPKAEPALEVAYLEPLLRAWVELIGLEATLKVVEVHGGTLLNIAHKAHRNADLVALIGRAHAAELGRVYGGERVFVPKALPALRALRDARIRAERPIKSLRQLAREYRLGERQILNITKDVLQGDDATMDLFADS